MLDRLYEEHGLRQLGLESLAAAEGPLDLSWAHEPPPYAPGEPMTIREDTIAHTLFLGEIGAVEMMGLVYQDVAVHGIDDAELSRLSLPMDTWVAPLEYIYNIALAGMKESEVERWERLYDAELYGEAFDYAVSTDPFAQEAYDRLNDSSNMASNEETLEIYALLRSRARRARIDLPEGTEEDLQACEDFLLTAMERSDVMAACALDLAASYLGQPVAINIGGMHTERVAGLLDDAGASYVLIRSLSQATGSLAGLLTLEQFERKMQGLSIGGENHIGAFIDGRKKPEPTCTTWWYESELFLNQALSGLVNSLRISMNDGSQHPAMVVWEEHLDDLAGGQYKECLSKGHVTSFETVSVAWEVEDGRYRPYFQAEVTVVNPETGEHTRVAAKVRLEPGFLMKENVTLREVLEEEHATMCDWNPDDPLSTAGAGPEPVSVCTGITVAWKGT